MMVFVTKVQSGVPTITTEIDPFTAGSISVVRGSASSRYGPDAIGGVIVVEPPEMLDAKGIQGRTQLAFSTNGNRAMKHYVWILHPTTIGPFEFKKNYSRSGTLSTPMLLGNTASEVWNTGVSVKYRDSIRIDWKHYQLQAGVFYGVKNHSPEDFFSQLDNRQPANTDLWTFGYDIDRPYQKVSHDVVSVHMNHRR